MTKVNFDRLQKVHHNLYQEDVIILGVVRNTKSELMIAFEMGDGSVDLDTTSQFSPPKGKS